MANSIVWNNAPEPIYNSGSSVPAVTYCDIQGGYPGTGNIDQLPEFANPGSDNFHLQPTSHCIDSGSNAAAQNIDLNEDFDGEDRILNGTVDMGADEFAGWSPWSYDNNPKNGTIQIGEFLQALGDYLDSQITIIQLLEVLGLYLL